MHVLMAAAAAAPESPWNPVTITTAIIASLSFLVAATGLVLGVVNYRHQSRRDFPKARWKTVWDRHEDGRLNLKFENEGAGAAINTELWVLIGREGEKRTWQRSKTYGTMKFGHPEEFGFSASTNRKVKVQLRWRHAHEPRTVHVHRTSARRR